MNLFLQFTLRNLYISLLVSWRLFLLSASHVRLLGLAGVALADIDPVPNPGMDDQRFSFFLALVWSGVSTSDADGDGSPLLPPPDDVWDVLCVLVDDPVVLGVL